MDELLTSFSQMNLSIFKAFKVLEYDDEMLSKYLHRKMIKHIDEVYNLFKESGDTELIVHSTTCGSDVCSDFKTSKFYCFVGNNSKNYCLIQIRLFDGIPGTIKFCSSILKPKGIELERFLEPSDDNSGRFPF